MAGITFDIDVGNSCYNLISLNDNGHQPVNLGSKTEIGSNV